MKWYRTDENNVVVEVMDPHPHGHTLEQCFHPDAGYRATDNDAIKQGMVFVNDAAAPPPPPPASVTAFMDPVDFADRARGLLAGSDRAVMAFFELGQPVSNEWFEYRAALRAIIANPTPDAVFPTEPEMPV